MRIERVEVDSWQLGDVTDHLKTQQMCDKAVREGPSSLQYVPDWFVTQQLKIWDDVNDYCNDGKIIEWYDGCKKCKTQKAEIEQQLMCIACHPTRWWDWRMSEDEKSRQKNCGSNR